MARARNGGRAGLRIEAETLDLRRGEDVPALTAYAFGQGGRLLGRAELKEGKGELHIAPTKEPEALRVVIGPPIDSEDEQEVLAALSRLDTPEVHVRGDQQLSEALRIPIDRAVWGCWFRFCTVRGTLLKRTTTGGINVDLPVCGAEVEIYEVDPVSVILPKIRTRSSTGSGTSSSRSSPRRPRRTNASPEASRSRRRGRARGRTRSPTS